MSVLLTSAIAVISSALHVVDISMGLPEPAHTQYAVYCSSILNIYPVSVTLFIVAK